MIEIAGAAGGGLSLGFDGDVMNTALHLARLGCDAALGTDPYSDQLIDMLEEEGVSTKLVVRDKERIRPLSDPHRRRGRTQFPLLAQGERHAGAVSVR